MDGAEESIAEDTGEIGTDGCLGTLPGIIESFGATDFLEALPLAYPEDVDVDVATEDFGIGGADALGARDVDAASVAELSEGKAVAFPDDFDTDEEVAAGMIGVGFGKAAMPGLEFFRLSGGSAELVLELLGGPDLTSIFRGFLFCSDSSCGMLEELSDV